jgi:uncharacterized membrane protein YhaH (DUF805 family)
MDSILASPLFMMCIMLAVVAVPFWRILSRTGHNGWWCLLVLVPFVNFVCLWVFAFKAWPDIAAHGKGLPE